MTVIENVQAEAERRMKKAIEATQNQLATIRTGRANPMMLDRVVVDYYGSPTPVKQVANISVQEGQTLVIQPYEKSQLGPIEKAISKSDVNLPVNSDGTVLRLTVPPMTEEIRKKMAKEVKAIGEDGKVAIRNVRREAMDWIKANDDLSEDDEKREEDAVQKLTDKMVKQLEDIVTAKEKEVLNN
jgi:ribosome recycling factor